MKPLHFLNFKAVRKGDIVCGVNRDLQTEGRTICHTYLYIYIYMYSIYIYISYCISFLYILRYIPWVRS